MDQISSSDIRASFGRSRPSALRVVTRDRVVMLLRRGFRSRGSSAQQLKHKTYEYHYTHSLSFPYALLDFFFR